MNLLSVCFTCLVYLPINVNFSKGSFLSLFKKYPHKQNNKCSKINYRYFFLVDVL